MSQLVAQWILVAAVFLTAVGKLFVSLTGRAAEEPSPIAGTIGAILSAIFALYLYNAAGALSLVLR